ncbi:MAG: hypothetical protein IKE70_03055 [Bacilli bacterium]|nr:hypothetical protein [Bacilli bacterium]
MKDYSLDREAKERFITNVVYHRNHTFTIYFANGKKISGIDSTKENLLKVKKVLDDQARRGIESSSVFERKKSNSGLLAAVSTAGFVSSLIWANSSEMTKSSSIGIYGLGAISLLAGIPSFVDYIRNKKKIQELDKIRYRNENMRKLESIQKYPNSLNGVSSRLKDIISRDKDPFSMFHLDDYSKEDLENIVSNIELEEDFQFTYRMRKNNKNRT